MSILNLRNRLIGRDDISWGMGSLVYQDYQGVVRTMPQVNATNIPADQLYSISQRLLDVIAVSTSAELTAAISYLGANPGTIYLKQGTYTPSALSVPGNVQLWFANGAVLHAPNDVTHTISGPVIAGPHQIFSWAGNGAFDLTYCPNPEMWFDWWGAMAEWGTGPFINDNSAALTKASASVGYKQTIRVGKGVWRIATPVDLYKQWAPIHLKGDSFWWSQIYIDVGANVGINIGDPSKYTQQLIMEDLSFIGPATCCTNALKITQCADTQFHNVNFYLGSTDYALDIAGCVNVSGDIRIRNATNNYFSWETPHDGIHVESSTTPYQSNVLDIKVYIGLTYGTGLFLDGTNFPSGIMKVSGTIEACTDYYVKLYKQEQVDLDLYTEGTGADILVDSCKGIDFKKILHNDSTGTLRLHNSVNINVNNFKLSNTHVRADSRNVVFGVGTFGATPVIDAPDTVFLAGPRADYGNYPWDARYPSQGPDKVNYCYNTNLERWKTSTPDNFTVSAATWTKEASVVHNTASSIKLVTTGASAYETLSIDLDANQLRHLKGKVVTYSWYLYAPTGQTLNTTAAEIFGADNPTVPSWGAATVYHVNDAVRKVTPDGYLFTCIAVTGDAKSGAVEPNWSSITVDGGNLVDNHVTWVRSTSEENLMARYTTTDQGQWKLISATFLVPNNATSLDNAVLYLYDLQAGGAATYYLSEPTIVLGNIGPMGYIPSSSDYFQEVGNLRIWSVTPSAGMWCQQNDIDLTTHQRCTASGVMGSGATWGAW